MIESPPPYTPPQSPYDVVEQDWLRRPRDRTLADYERIHKQQGFVFCTPKVYVMGRPVRKYAPIEQIRDPWHRFAFDTCDTWYVFQLSGDINEAWKMLPWSLPWIAWCRDNDPLEEVRFFEMARLKWLCGVQ